MKAKEKGWIVVVSTDDWGAVKDIGFYKESGGYIDKEEALKAFISDWNEKEARKKYKGIPRDVKVWVFAQDYGNHVARVLETTFGEAIDHEYDWGDIYFIKRIAEERLKKFEEEE